MKTRILLVHNRLLVREALAALLSVEHDLDVIGHVSTVAEALRMASATNFDCVVLEFQPGAARTADLPLLCSKQRVLVMADSVPPATTSYLMESGVAGVLSNVATSSLLVDSIRKVVSGLTWRELAHLRFCSPFRLGSELLLTPRQRAVLRLVCEGLPNKEISYRLRVSDSSVKCTIQQLFDKTTVRTRSQLMRIVIETLPELLISVDETVSGFEPSSSRGSSARPSLWRRTYHTTAKHGVTNS
jgi:DNA-binding NarL/FixJ family response regulator